MILNNRINCATGAFFNALVAVRTPGFIFDDFKNTVVEQTCQDDDCCNYDEIGV